jgi:hypothetical protein
LNSGRIKEWLAELPERLDPPGCEAVQVDAFGDSRRGRVTIGVVPDHRFAFFYWARYRQGETVRKRVAPYKPPVLVTVDFHDDVGRSCDFSRKELLSIDCGDEKGLALFCWCRLRGVNDGQIAPALSLDFFSDVYVLLKQNRKLRRNDRSQAAYTKEDLSGKGHSVRYFDRTAELVAALRDDGRPVFLDVDLDYFTRAQAKELGAEKLVGRRAIRRLFSLKGGLMPLVLPRLVGMTIALEPRYCGGFAQSLKALDVLNRELFGGRLGTDDCRWKRTGGAGRGQRARRG